MTEHTNGTRPRGRAVPQKPEITLSGIPVRLNRIGGSTIQAIRSAVFAEWRASSDPDKQEPTPPIITAGDITEPNHADPDYQQARREWAARRNQAAAERLLDYLAFEVIEPVDGIDGDAVAEYRRGLARAGVVLRWDDDPTLSQAERDRLIYIQNLLIDRADRAELEVFNKWVYQGQAPTEDEVRDALASFRGDVGRPAAGGGDPAPAPVGPVNGQAG
jgi:hypothetical protein